MPRVVGCLRGILVRETEPRRTAQGFARRRWGIAVGRLVVDFYGYVYRPAGLTWGSAPEDWSKNPNFPDFEPLYFTFSPIGQVLHDVAVAYAHAGGVEPSRFRAVIYCGDTPWPGC